MPKNKPIDAKPLILAGDSSIYKTDNETHYDYEAGKIYENVMLIPLSADIYFPYMQIASTVSHPDLKASVKKAYKDNELVFLFLASDTQPNEFRNTDIVDVYNLFGSLGIITTVTENQDNSITFQATLSHQGTIINLLRRSPYLRSNIKCVFPERIKSDVKEHRIGIELEKEYQKLMQFISDNDRRQLIEMLAEIPEYSIRRLNFMMQNSPLNTEQRYNLLGIPDYSERRKKFLELMKSESQAMQYRMDIHNKTLTEIGNKQKEEFLRTQLRQIRIELGEGEDNDENELRLRASKKKWTDETQKHFEKELRKMMRFNPTSPEYALQYSYLDNFLNLPWLEYDNSTFTLSKVEEVLDHDHYGLEKVKERIIEQMAIMKLRGDTKSPIICLYGPPGVGKTSLGKSIAEALGRKYVRVALGGLHDEAEIRGHRRTYLGSMPGRIIMALEKSGSGDPVMVLDEIDKIGADYKGDPAQALLEVLDPEQNFKFHDNYIDFDYDLSKVLFIATANSLQTISAPLLDRMELIEITGYGENEKIEIAKRHVIAKSLKEVGFDEKEISFSDDALLEIINSYTRESGVRQLEKKINKILRKLARLKVAGETYPKNIDKSMISTYLGKPEVFNDIYENNDIPGIVTGLAWTQAGGDILFIESSIAPGKEGKLTLTGNLGDVMKESAIIALQYIKANYKKLGIKKEELSFDTVHIHVPEGAVPKDGPSAGITILTSLASAFTNRKVKSHIAMTGEMTLRGKILPVGGIKEKVLAAKRAGIKTILMSTQNRKDVEEIKSEYLSGLTFHYVDHADEVLDFALI